MADVKQDYAWRQSMVLKMQQGGHVYTEEETALIAKGFTLLDAGKGRSLRHSKTVSSWTKHDECSGLLLGAVECHVYGASPEEIVAHLMHCDSEVVLEVKNPHHTVTFVKRRTTPFVERTSLHALLWRRLFDSPLAYVWVEVPIRHHPKVALEHDAERADSSRCFRLTHVRDGVTNVEMECACFLDVKGPSLPMWATNEFAALMSSPYNLQTYFLKVRLPGNCTADDGTLIGHMIVDTAEAAEKPDRASAISACIMQTAVLRECGFASLDAMLTAIVASVAEEGLDRLGRNSHFVQLSGELSPASLSRDEAVAIGQQIASNLARSLVVDTVLPEIIRNCNCLALRVMDERHAWFRPMVEVIGKRLKPSAIHVRQWLEDVEHDRSTRNAMISQMHASEWSFSSMEDAAIKDGVSLLDAFSSQQGKATDLRLVRTVDRSRVKAYDGQLVGETVLVIRGATPEDIIAFLMDVSSKHERSRLDPETDVCDEVREVRSLHHKVEYYECKTAPFRNRTMLQALVWKQLSETQFVWVTVPIGSHPSVDPKDEQLKVRAELKRCFRLTSLTSDTTKVEYACAIDLRGNFPRSFTNHVLVPQVPSLGGSCRTQTHPRLPASGQLLHIMSLCYLILVGFSSRR